jgi:hypothetical protein
MRKRKGKTSDTERLIAETKVKRKGKVTSKVFATKEELKRSSWLYRHHKTERWQDKCQGCR